MSCRYCDDPNQHAGGICAPCSMKQFGSPYDADLKRLEAWRKRRDEREHQMDGMDGIYLNGAWVHAALAERLAQRQREQQIIKEQESWSLEEDGREELGALILERLAREGRVYSTDHFPGAE